MKKFLVIASCVTMVIAIASCNKVRRSPGRVYMPDMSYSRAYETYATNPEDLRKEGINYIAKPVEGTIAQGDMYPYTLKNDAAGYAQSATTKNPLPHDTIDAREAERLYLVNCAICHGTKLDGNGPLYNGGDGPYPSKPANLMVDTLTEGRIFHVATYGKNAMGSYASQLSPKQRWMVADYIKTKQSGAAATGASKDSTGAKTATMDSTGAKKVTK